MATFGLRKDFHPAAKQSLEDDITASVVIPTTQIHGIESNTHSVKFSRIASIAFSSARTMRLFAVTTNKQRPTWPHLGISFPTSNLSSKDRPRRLSKMPSGSAIHPSHAGPHQGCCIIHRPGFFVSSAHPRMVDGVPTKNPRYLQIRPTSSSRRLSTSRKSLPDCIANSP